MSPGRPAPVGRVACQCPPRVGPPRRAPSALSQVCLFLKRGADQHALDHAQQDPLSIAVQEANADIVTL